MWCTCHVPGYGVLCPSALFFGRHFYLLSCCRSCRRRLCTHMLNDLLVSPLNAERPSNFLHLPNDLLDKPCMITGARRHIFSPFAPLDTYLRSYRTCAGVSTRTITEDYGNQDPRMHTKTYIPLFYCQYFVLIIIFSRNTCRFPSPLANSRSCTFHVVIKGRLTPWDMREKH